MKLTHKEAKSFGEIYFPPIPAIINIFKSIINKTVAKITQVTQSSIFEFFSYILNNIFFYLHNGIFVILSVILSKAELKQY